MPRVALTLVVSFAWAAAGYAQQDRYSDRGAYRAPESNAYRTTESGAFDPFAEPRNVAPAAAPEPAQSPPALLPQDRPAAVPIAERALPVPFHSSQARNNSSSVVPAVALEVVEESRENLPAQQPEKSLPLAPPKASNRPGMAGGAPSLVTMLASLVLVLGVFSAAAWVLRRGMPKGMGLLPPAAVEVLGRTPIAARQQAYLVRIGGKMLLVAVSPTGIETLTEIIDPLEVDRLSGICQQSRRRSPTKEFEQVFQEFHAESAPPGFVGEPVRPTIDFSNLGTVVPAKSRGAANG